MSGDKEKTLPKGSVSNPYTEDEYNTMCDADTWKGGYVKGLGYVGAQTTIYGSSSCSESSYNEDEYSELSDPFGSWSDSWSEMQSPCSGEGNPSSQSNDQSTHSSCQDNGQVPSIQSGSNGDRHFGNYNVPDILPTTKFRGYKESDPQGCLRRYKEMLAAVGCSLRGSEILMANHNAKGRATTPSRDFYIGMEYIDSQLQLGNPVIVSIDRKEGTSMGSTRQDQAGDHFVIIVGGNRTSGYHYYDPATSNRERGTSNNNRFTLQGGMLKSKNTCTGKEQEYTLTGIRKNK